MQLYNCILRFPNNNRRFNMTKVFTIITFIVCSISIQAQTNNIDEQLLERYSKTELASLKTDNPTEYKFAKYCIENAFYIAAGSEEKNATSNYKTIKIKDLTEINFYELKIELKQNAHQVFIIKGTSKILIVKSRVHILNELKNK